MLPVMQQKMRVATGSISTRQDDLQLEHRRNVMDFVGQIDRALEEDRFILDCQKIAHVDEDSGEHAHYEILPTLLDENGESMPP